MWREPVHKVKAAVVEAVVKLARGESLDYNDRHFTKELAEWQDNDNYSTNLKRASCR